MRVSLNGEPQELESGATLKTLLEQLDINPSRVAVALNTAVVPRGEWPKQTLADGDRIEIIEAVGGG